MMRTTSSGWRFLIVAPSLFIIILRATPSIAAPDFYTIECTGRKLNVFRNDRQTWDGARKACIKYGSVLARMLNKEDRKCMYDRIAAPFRDAGLWLGGKRKYPNENCNANKNNANPCRHDAWDGYCKEFYWIEDNVRITQEYWAGPQSPPSANGEEPNNRQCEEDCVELNFQQNGANDIACKAPNGYICNAAKSQPPKPPPPPGQSNPPGPAPTLIPVPDCTSVSPISTPHYFYPIIFYPFYTFY